MIFLGISLSSNGIYAGGVVLGLMHLSEIELIMEVTVLGGMQTAPLKKSTMPLMVRNVMAVHRNINL